MHPVYVDRVELDSVVIVIPNWSSITTVRVRLSTVPNHILAEIRKNGRRNFSVDADVTAQSELGLNIRNWR